jgi:UPF0755 protein
MRKTLFIISPLLVIALLGVLVLFWWLGAVKPPGTSVQEIDFLIVKGRSASQVARELEEKHLVKSALALKFYLQVTGLEEKIPAGEYSLPGNLNLFQLANLLLKGPRELWVTIPEGLRREEIVLKLVEALKISGQEKDLFASEFLKASEGKEGQLFPDTYLFPKNVTGTKVAQKMLSTFKSKTIKLSDPSDYTFDEIVIIASMVEREAKRDEERPVIAGIIKSRIEKGWPLQVDASVQYGLASNKLKKGQTPEKFWEPLSKDDLEIPSAFNTYLNLGLPPGPICNPGLASLEGAFGSTKTAYLFYLHDEKGGIHYARTLEEHNQNVRTYLK